MHFDKWNLGWFGQLYFGNLQFAFPILDLSKQSLGLLIQINVCKN